MPEGTRTAERSRRTSARGRVQDTSHKTQVSAISSPADAYSRIRHPERAMPERTRRQSEVEGQLTAAF
jgi:hypothetical protein